MYSFVLFPCLKIVTNSHFSVKHVFIEIVLHAGTCSVVLHLFTDIEETSILITVHLLLSPLFRPPYSYRS